MGLKPIANASELQIQRMALPPGGIERPAAFALFSFP
jgi:hypothetical protein